MGPEMESSNAEEKEKNDCQCEEFAPNPADPPTQGA